MPVHPPFRENHLRAVYITGTLNDDLLKRIAPEIQKLRFTSEDPITAYIDSTGGSPSVADSLVNLIKAPTQDGNARRLVTVVHTLSGSAATDLLIRGNYAIAYPTARIHYHGLQRNLDGQFSEVELHEESKKLSIRNEEFAIDLARTIFPRVIRLIVLEFKLSDTSDMEELAKRMSAMLSSQYAQMVSASAAAVSRLWDILSEIKFEGEMSSRKREIDILHQLLEIEYRDKEESHRKLPDLMNGGLELLAEEFRLFFDAFAGKNDQVVQEICRKHGILFLEAGKEREEFDAIPEANVEERKKYLVDHVCFRLEKVFYFVLTYCRRLQRAEFVFSGSEAYALGLIDEVCGQHHAWRHYVENRPPAKVTEAPSDQGQPTASGTEPKGA